MNISQYVPYIIAFVGVVSLISLFFAGFVSAKSNEVVIITGFGKQRSLVGKAGWKIPILEQTSRISIEQFSVDVNTSEAVPTQDFINVKADAVVKAKIATRDIKDKDGNILYTKDDLLEAAAQNFLNRDTVWISEQIQDVLEGNLREIIGQMKLKDMVNDRQSFAEKVFSNAQPDLAKMGLEIIAFTVQNFKDDNKAIENLGIENLTTIKKEASNASAIADREMAEVAANEKRLAAQAKAESELAIAQKENEVKIELARLKAISDKEQAQADAVLEIEQQIQRKEIERETADANIVKQQKEAEVAAEEAKVQEQRLNAQIRKQADAEKYAREKAAEADAYERAQKAEADKLERQAQADAELYETTKEAEAQKARSDAELDKATKEAEGIRAKGLAEAEAIEAKLKAEAQGLNEKAEAMKKFGEAAMAEMLINVLPEIAKNVAAPLNNVDSITMYGEGNSSKLVGDIMTSMNQVTAGVGFDMSQFLQATFTGRAMGNAIAKEIDSESK